MRMEELSNSRYIKGTDTVEKYLLNLVKSYFKNANIADINSREYIIRRAVARMKEEFKYENIGVLSITLDDGVARTGPVKITLSDLGGEPVITPKRSAFNVDFGDKANTACEGNDPRLSDARIPLAHIHSIQDINGLEGRLSTLLSAITRADAYAHTHKNIDVLNKLVYTGTASTIDLNIIDTLPQEINQKLSEVRTSVNNLINNVIPQKVAQIQRDLDNTDTKIRQAENTIASVHDGYLQQAKNYTDSKIPAVLDQFTGCFDGYITEAQLESMTIGAISYIDSMMSSMKALVNQTPNSNTGFYYYSTPITDEILAELTNRNVSLNECLIDILIRKEYTDTEGNSRYEWTQTPYLYMNASGDILGTLLAGVNFEGKSIWFSYRMATPENSDGTRPGLPNEVKNTIIITKFYSKRKVT